MMGSREFDRSELARIEAGVASLAAISSMEMTAVNGGGPGAYLRDIGQVIGEAYRYTGELWAEADQAGWPVILP